MKNNRKHNSQGTREWSEKTFNCCEGCSHDCLYCYAKEGATRYTNLDEELGTDAMEKLITYMGGKKDGKDSIRKKESR